MRHGNSLLIQWLGLSAFTAGAWVRSLVRELRSCKLHGVVQKKKKLWDTKRYKLQPIHRKKAINKNCPWGLPWWRSGWESACQGRGHRFEPWSGKIPHATEQLGLWATTTEPARLELVLRNKRGRDSERPMHRDEEWPPLATTRESPCTETKTQHSQK